MDSHVFELAYRLGAVGLYDVRHGDNAHQSAVMGKKHRGFAVFGKLLRHNFALMLLQVVLGGVVYYVVYQTVILFGLDPDLLKMLSAIVVAIFLAVPYWKKRYFSKGRLGKGVNNHA